MSVWENFKELHVPFRPASIVRPRFSLTSDIISFRRCSRQYRYFGNDGFVPARSTQAFYGTVIHQVLDWCHRLYRGHLGRPVGTIATDADITSYFRLVRNALRSHGVRAANDDVADQAEEVLKIFNAIEGPTLYRRVRETEYRLENDRGDFVLRGVVDVIARTEDASDDPNAPYDPANMEIWDYKGSTRIGKSDPDWKNYEWQMLVYAQLYRLRTGAFPARAVLYFMNELAGIDRAKGRPQSATHSVHITETKVTEALARFDTDAREIMACRATGLWPLPQVKPEVKTCNVCDIRYSCPTVNVPTVTYQIRNPFP